MRLAGLFSICINACFLAASASAYFIITQPQRDTQWVNGQVNVLSWEKGLLDGITGFDVEMARMSADGLMLIAKNVLAKPGSLNVFIENVPPGNDYVAIFINSTHGLMYGTSQRFTILPASSTPTSVPQTPNAKAATVTVTTGPNPTAAFVTTFPPLPNAALATSPWMVDRGLLGGAFGLTIGCMIGAAWTLMW